MRRTKIPIPILKEEMISSVLSGFVSNVLNPNQDTCVDAIFGHNAEATSLIDIPTLVRCFHNRLKALEDNFSEFKQINQYAEALSSIPGIVDQYLAIVDVAVQPKYDRIREETHTENQQFLDSIDEGMKKVIKELVKKEVSKITPKIEKLVNEQLESKVLVRSSKEAKTSHAVAANLSELELKKILIDKMEANNSINRYLWRYGHNQNTAQMMIKNPPLEQTGGPKEEGSKTHKQSASQSASVEETIQTTDVFEAHAHQEFEIGVHDEQAEEEVHHLPDWFQQPKRLPSPSNLARRQDPRESFDELTDNTFDFSAFVINRLNVKTLTPKLLAGPTFELMKGTCKSLTELEYFCEEVYKATIEKLDWINPEGHQYPHDLRKPLPLVKTQIE
ncbi:hypothetical protein Tco_0675040 [Tanacetum coccineum]